MRLAEVVEGRPYLQHGIEVKPGDVVLDVGANIGVAAAFFAVECGAGLVHSFEPIAPIFAYLEQNLRHFPACIPHNYGLGADSGITDITYYPDICEISGLHADPSRDRSNLRRILLGHGGSEEQVDEGLRGRFSTETVRCELRTMSDVLRTESIDQVDLLKLDVEGAELEVLEGIGDRDWPSIKQVVGELHLDTAGRNTFIRALEDRHFKLTLVQEPGMERTPFHLFYARRR